MIASVATILTTASSLPPHWNLQGHRAVVTGGSKGLGRAIVEELLAHGCEVLTCARDVSPLASLLADERCTAVQADVSLESGRGALLASQGKSVRALEDAERCLALEPHWVAVQQLRDELAAKVGEGDGGVTEQTKRLSCLESTAL